MIPVLVAMYRPTIDDGMSADGLRLYLALLFSFMFVLPCGWGMFAACRASIRRLRGRPAQMFPGAPLTAPGAVVFELAALIFCALGFLYGAANILFMLEKAG